MTCANFEKARSQIDFLSWLPTTTIISISHLYPLSSKLLTSYLFSNHTLYTFFSSLTLYSRIGEYEKQIDRPSYYFLASSFEPHPLIYSLSSTYLFHSNVSSTLSFFHFSKFEGNQILPHFSHSLTHSFSHLSLFLFIHSHCTLLDTLNLIHNRTITLGQLLVSFGEVLMLRWMTNWEWVGDDRMRMQNYKGHACLLWIRIKASWLRNENTVSIIWTSFAEDLSARRTKCCCWSVALPPLISLHPRWQADKLSSSSFLSFLSFFAL